MVFDRLPLPLTAQPNMALDSMELPYDLQDPSPNNSELSVDPQKILGLKATFTGSQA